MHWIVELRGNKSNLKCLSKVFIYKNFTIVYENKKYFLKSEEFDKITEYNEVKEKVIGVLNSSSVVGLFLLCIGKLKYFISKLRDDGVTELFLESGSTMYVNINLNKYVKNNKDVRNMFNLVNQGFRSWDTLYKIFEFLQMVKYIPRLRKKNNDELLDKLYQFQQTANHYRHVNNEVYPLPNPPMSFLEAESLIKSVLLKWLAQKDKELIKEKL